MGTMRGLAIFVVLTGTLLGGCSDRAGGADDTGGTGSGESGDVGESGEAGTSGAEGTSSSDGDSDDGNDDDVFPDFWDGAACEEYAGRVEVTVEPTVYDLGLGCFPEACEDGCEVVAYVSGGGMFELNLDCPQLGPVALTAEGTSTKDLGLLVGDSIDVRARAEVGLGVGYARIDLFRDDAALAFAWFEGSDDGYDDIDAQLDFADVVASVEPVCVDPNPEPCGQLQTLGITFADGGDQFSATPWDDVGDVSGFRIVVNDAVANPHPCGTDQPPERADVVVFGPVGG